MPRGSRKAPKGGVGGFGPLYEHMSDGHFTQYLTGIGFGIDDAQILAMAMLRKMVEMGLREGDG